MTAVCSRSWFRQIALNQPEASFFFGIGWAFWLMGFFALFPCDEQSHLDVMDVLFFVGVIAGLLILLIFGLVSAKAKINAGCKEIS